MHSTLKWSDISLYGIKLEDALGLFNERSFVAHVSIDLLYFFIYIQRQLRSEPPGYNRLHQQPSSPQGQGQHRHHQQPSSLQGQGQQVKNRYPQPQPHSPNTSSPYSNKHQQQQYSYRTGHPSNLFKRANQNESMSPKYGKAANQMRRVQNIPTKQNPENRNVPNSHRGHQASPKKDYSSSPNNKSGHMNRGPCVEGQRQPQVSVVENTLFSSGVGITNPILISPPFIYPQLGMHSLQFYPVIHPPNIKSIQPSNIAGNSPAVTDSIPGGITPTSCPVIVPMPAGTPVYVLAEPPKTGQTITTTDLQVSHFCSVFLLSASNHSPFTDFSLI